VKEACQSACLRGYDDRLGTGDLRYIKMDVQQSSKLVQLSLVWHASSRKEAGKRLEKFLQELTRRQDTWYQIWVNYNPASLSVSRIFSYEENSWERLEGSEEPLCEQLDLSIPIHRPHLRFPPQVFRQANLRSFSQIVAALRRFVAPGSRVVEMYGGVGTIGLHLADLVSSLTCSDENPHNERCFNASVQDLPLKLQKRLQYCPGAAVRHISSLTDADVLIVDPPRKGLDEELVTALSRPWTTPSLRLVLYVSCGFPALQRDATRLLQAGWTVTHAEGFVLFPGADHIETFCVFER